MSGIVGSNLNIKGSGLVAQLGTDGQVLTSSGVGLSVAFEDLAAGISWQAVETGSTMTAVAGEGYPINTTSNACTITLPASASNGDQIIFTDYARNWGTNGIVIDSNGLNYQGDDDTFTVEYGTDGQSVKIVYSGATKGWIPTIDDAVSDVPFKGNPYGIFYNGYNSGGSGVSTSQLVSNTGVVGSDVAAVGTPRWAGGGTEYGGDKGIAAYGYEPAIGQSSLSNLISNTGVVAADVTGVGTARSSMGACRYGSGGTAIMAYGSGPVGMSNLISSSGVIATDTSAVPGNTDTQYPGAAEYGGDKGIFYGGTNGSRYNLSHLVSNVGVIGSDVAGVGTARSALAGCDYGGNKAIMAYGTTGSLTNVSNLISNTGVVATDTTGVGTNRSAVGACEYGGKKGIFGFGTTGSASGITNLVSDTGVIASDVAATGAVRGAVMACSYG